MYIYIYVLYTYDFLIIMIICKFNVLVNSRSCFTPLLQNGLAWTNLGALYLKHGQMEARIIMYKCAVLLCIVVCLTLLASSFLLYLSLRCACVFKYGYK